MNFSRRYECVDCSADKSSKCYVVRGYDDEAANRPWKCPDCYQEYSVLVRGCRACNKERGEPGYGEGWLEGGKGWLRGTDERFAAADFLEDKKVAVPQGFERRRHIRNVFNNENQR